MRYTTENLNTERFIQFPSGLMYGEKYRTLSMNAKGIYCLLHDRLSFSVQNGWIDETGEIYVFYPVGKIAELTGLSERTVNRALIDLRKYGLIETQRTTGNGAYKYYVHIAEGDNDSIDGDTQNHTTKCRLPHDKMSSTTRQNVATPHDKMSSTTRQNVAVLRLYNTNTISKTNNTNTLSYPTDTRKRAQDDTPYQTIVDAFNAICIDLPQVKSLSETRKKAIKARFKELDRNTDKIRQLFTKVQESDFLAGRKEGTNWRAGFDWIIKPSNTAKILEGNYDNREHSSSQKNNEQEGDIYAQYEEYERNQRMPWE